ncbi:hypothetical protein NEMBOFW57_009994 [Staphylotrichum longicolle]|uniref:RING-type E3 ubiquitin transferase n=1 Tax=Staphylotrichum longicolle TaxID=669026 RepID=A0AAD4ETR6_9PEZI|nr:hypothetical protein NEMBOFW57_009994 [Staphylotrichum longicolle]
MADHGRHDQESIPENDPRHFHNRQQEGASSGEAAPAPGSPEPGHEPVSHPGQRDENISETSPAHQDEPSSNETPNRGGAADAADAASGTNPHTAHPHVPRFTFRFATHDTPQVTFVTFMTGNMTGNMPPPPTQNAPPVTFFGMQFIPSFTVFPPPPPPTVNNSPPAEADHNNTTQQQQQGEHPANPEQQQPGSEPHPQPTQNQHQPNGPHPIFPPNNLLATILTSLFNPANAVFGDAVYSQEAFDRILTQLREQAQPGGAPPASQAALDRLQVREVDDKMLAACGGSSKCVVCVDDMAKGEKAAVLPCEHFFHGECVMPWLRLHGTCPVCRRSVEVEGQGDGAKKTMGAGGGEVGNGAAAPGAEPEARSEATEGMDCS